MLLNDWERAEAVTDVARLILSSGPDRTYPCGWFPMSGSTGNRRAEYTKSPSSPRTE